MKVDKFGEEKVVITLAGNKSDQEGKFNNQHVLEYCNSRGYGHVEVSAKSGDNVDLVFKSLAEKLTKVHPKVQKK